MSDLKINEDIDIALALLAYLEVVNGSKAAGMIAETLCYAIDSEPSAAKTALIAAMLGAAAELMKKEGLT
jgi:hypothetical protein